jgi:hypothetical protein
VSPASRPNPIVLEPLAPCRLVLVALPFVPDALLPLVPEVAPFLAVLFLRFDFVVVVVVVLLLLSFCWVAVVPDLPLCDELELLFPDCADTTVKASKAPSVKSIFFIIRMLSCLIKLDYVGCYLEPTTLS